MNEKKILIVDDDIDSIDVLRTLLEKEGFLTESASDGITALKKIDENSYDLIILDVLLPGYNGYELLEKIKDNPETKNIPVIMFTAVYVTDEDQKEAIQKGADEYFLKADALIQKPLKKQKLLNSVYELLKIDDKFSVDNEKKLTIAIIEDDLDTLEYMGILMESMGYEIEKFSNPLKFWEQFEKEKYELLIVDYNMPNMNGIELIEKVRKVDDYVGIIIVTAYGNDELAHEAIEKGANDFVSKPIKKESFLHRLEENIKTIKLHMHIKRLIIELKDANIKLMKKNEKLQEANQQLKVLAEKDTLTNLYNRRVFFEILEREISRAKRYKNKFTVMMIDIDDFKKINDQNGHLEGDKILKKMGQIILNNIRKPDFAARYGGEEFSVLLLNSDVNESINIAKRLKNKVENKLICTISIGMAEFTDKMKSDQIIKKADSRLYEAKEKGKNTVVYE